jgi:hypothetical protein
LGQNDSRRQVNVSMETIVHSDKTQRFKNFVARVSVPRISIRFLLTFDQQPI